MAISVIAVFLVFTLGLLYIYVRLNDRKIMRLPSELKGIAANPFTPEAIRKAAETDPISIGDVLPPKTGRRYIVVGGSGFLGGWIVVHLLRRGEDPKRIRIVDLQPPSRPDLQESLANGVDFIKADITDTQSVRSAFTGPWPESTTAAPEITVFHTAAIIRFYERHPSLVPFSAKVNVAGVQNVIDASRACGATILCATSSASVGVRNTRFLLAPWEKEPNHFVQVIRDDIDLSPKLPNHYFSNYAYTKFQGEQLVRQADRSVGVDTKVMRTGCIRPGNGIYGSHGDTLGEFYLKRKTAPTWIPDTVQHFVYVENCSLAHLCYEQCLLEPRSAGQPDIGGRAFNVTDDGPPIAYRDAYAVLNVLTDGETVFTIISSTAMLLLSHLVEAYYIFGYSLSTSSFFPFTILSRIIPRVQGDIINLQPSLWSLVNVHLVFDGSRARASRQDGGLGYNPPWTSLSGFCQLVKEFKQNRDLAQVNMDGDGSNPLSGLGKAEASVQRALEAAQKLGVKPSAVN